MSKDQTNGFKDYGELKFSDDFMFGVTMQDVDLCHDVIELLTGQPVGELQEVESQKGIQFTSGGIRRITQVLCICRNRRSIR